jgi:TP901 family phage tail tape measure protein
MAQAGQVFVNFGANTQGLLAGTARAGNILRRFSQTGVGAAIVMGASFVTLSRVMTGFATSAISGFKDFEYHIVRAKALSGATAGEFIRMSGTAEELGRTTEFMAKDIAAGMSNLALAGFNANEIIKMIPDSLRLATAGGVALAKTNTIMANAIRGFSLEADQANQVANVLTATFTTTNTTLESLAQTFKNAVGVLATLGVKMEEVAAAAGVLGDVGISASVAGTGLKNFGIKLAKTFGMLKDGAKSAREFFESLGVTKERLFDAETGTLNMVEAVGAFKESMDKLGAARAPEFLAQFAKLFGARAAASLTALVRQAEAFQIQAENTRLTEMVGDVQKVFENMQDAAGQTIYMTNLQEGLHDAVLGMVQSLEKGNTIMEEFTEHGLGAGQAVERMSRNFEQTSKILEDTFGDTSVFTKTTDGLLQITKFSKNNSKEMIKYGKILDELSKKGIGAKRRRQLEEEAATYKGIIESSQRTVKEMTALGRARTLTLTAQIKSLRAMKDVKGGRSKEVLQLEALNRIYKGNEKNILLAANALGIQVKKGDKLAGTLGRVKSQLLDTTASIEKQNFAMQRWVSQAAMTNTAMDMQRTQLETLDGTFKLFKSGLELVSNKIAKALAPALDSTIKSATVFLRALTLNNEEIMRGVTATEKLNDAMNETFKIFKKDGGVLKEMKKGFEGLSSIGKTLAATMGILGASGLAAGGAFIWVQALGPAFMALAGTFFTMVVPVMAVVAVLVLLGIRLKAVHEKIKTMSDAAKESGGAMIEIYMKIKQRVDAVGDAYDRFIEKLETILGLTSRLNIVGGKFTLFDDKDVSKVVNLKSTMESLDKAFEKLDGSSKEAGEQLKKAFEVGNAPEINRLLKENEKLAEAIGLAGLKAGFATGAQATGYRETNSLLTDALKNQKAAEETVAKQIALYDQGRVSLERLNEAKKNSADADEEVIDLTKRRDKLYSKIVGHQGKIGKLTAQEETALVNIKGNIDAQQKSVLKTKTAFEAQLKLQKAGKGNITKLTEAMKAYKKEHELLVDSQKRYNNILSKAMDRNPFVLMARHIKNIIAGAKFQKFLTDVAVLLSKLMDVALHFISIVGPPFMEFIKSVGKAMVALWPSINKLLTAILKLADSVFTAIGLILVDVFGFAQDKGGSVVAALGEAIERRQD